MSKKVQFSKNKKNLEISWKYQKTNNIIEKFIMSAFEQYKIFNSNSKYDKVMVK